MKKRNKTRVKITFDDLDIGWRYISIPKLKERMPETEFIIGSFYDVFQSDNFFTDVDDSDILGFINFRTIGLVYTKEHYKKVDEFISKLNEILNEFYDR